MLVARTPSLLAASKARVLFQFQEGEGFPFKQPCRAHNDTVWEGLTCQLKMENDPKSKGKRLSFLDIFFPVFERFDDFDRSLDQPYISAYKPSTYRWVTRERVYKNSWAINWAYLLER